MIEGQIGRQIRDRWIIDDRKIKQQMSRQIRDSGEVGRQIIDDR